MRISKKLLLLSISALLCACTVVDSGKDPECVKLCRDNARACKSVITVESPIQAARNANCALELDDCESSCPDVE